MHARTTGRIESGDRHLVSTTPARSSDLGVTTARSLVSKFHVYYEMVGSTPAEGVDD